MGEVCGEEMRLAGSSCITMVTELTHFSTRTRKLGVGSFGQGGDPLPLSTEMG